MPLTVISNHTPATLHAAFGAPPSRAFRLDAHADTVVSARKCAVLRIKEHHVSVPLRLGHHTGARWMPLAVPPRAECLVYYNKLSRKHHRLLIFPRRDTSSFLSLVPDSVPLSSLVLPGTHETMASHGWPFSQCQSPSTPLERQLHAGIRVLDIRLAIVDSRLISYHGVYPQHAPFTEIISTVHAFLAADSTSRETIVMSIKQEDSDTQRFPTLVRDEILASPGGLGMWYLENRIPTLGEVRGKVVMFSRFGGDGHGWDNGAIGIHPPIWPDSEKLGFTWNCQNTLVQTHDWYGIFSFLSIPEKAALSTEILIASRDHPCPILSISFLSASSIPLALPPMTARGFGWPRWGIGFEGVNSRVGKWLLNQLNEHEGGNCAGEGPRIRGWVLMDFYEDPVEQGLIPLLIECNFRGRRSGEEGWV